MRRYAITMLSLAGAVAFAQSNPAYIQFTPGAVKGALYKPDSGPAPHVASVLMHRTANFLSHIGAKELSIRGFLVLAMNPRSDDGEAMVRWEDNALDARIGVEFLCRQPDIPKVLLLGHSGGGPTTQTAHRNIRPGSKRSISQLRLSV